MLPKIKRTKPSLETGVDISNTLHLQQVFTPLIHLRNRSVNRNRPLGPMPSIREPFRAMSPVLFHLNATTEPPKDEKEFDPQRAMKHMLVEAPAKIILKRPVSNDGPNRRMAFPIKRKCAPHSTGPTTWTDAAHVLHFSKARSATVTPEPLGSDCCLNAVQWLDRGVEMGAILETSSFLACSTSNIRQVTVTPTKAQSKHDATCTDNSTLSVFEPQAIITAEDDSLRAADQTPTSGLLHQQLFPPSVPAIPRSPNLEHTDSSIAVVPPCKGNVFPLHPFDEHATKAFLCDQIICLAKKRGLLHRVLGPTQYTGNDNVSPTKYQYSNRGFSRSLEEVYTANPDLEAAVAANGRVIARRRVFTDGDYASWEYVHHSSHAACQQWTCLLQRGGMLVMQLNRFDLQDCAALKEEVERCSHLKLYNGRGSYQEPRVHALASNLGGGYRYNSTKMKAFPLVEVPRVQRLAQCLAQEHLIDDWNIGVDLLIYRSGDDSIGWHEDDTQGESIVLCAVVHVGKQTRSLCIQPNTAPIEGDEQIEVYPGPGDMYRMDAEMQQHYVHSVLKKNESQTPPKTERDLAACRRVVLIFRHGDFVDIEKDSGCFIESLEPPDCSLVYVFGDLPDLCRDKLYSRAELLQMKAHRADRRGVSGNIHVGVDAIIVKNINIENGEADNGNQIFYYANSKLGGASLFYSYVKKQPIRVFRSSGGKSKYCPKWTEKVPMSVYQYGGLFLVIQVWSDTTKADEMLMGEGRCPTDAVLFHMTCVSPYSPPLRVAVKETEGANRKGSSSNFTMLTSQ